MTHYIYSLVMILFVAGSCSKNVAPNDSIEFPDALIDTSFWSSNDVVKFRGVYTSIDSIVIGGHYPDHILEFHSRSDMERLYRVRRYDDSLFLTFDPVAVNGTAVFSLNDSNALGWYSIQDKFYKISNDTLYFKAQFDYKDHADNLWHYRDDKYWGVVE